MTRVAADIEVLGLRKLFRQTVAGEEVVAIQHLDFNIRSGRIRPLCFELGLAGNYSDKLVELCKPTLEKLAYDTGDPRISFCEVDLTLCVSGA